MENKDSSICLNYHAVCLMNISDRERIHLTQQGQHISHKIGGKVLYNQIEQRKGASRCLGSLSK